MIMAGRNQINFMRSVTDVLLYNVIVDDCVVYNRFQKIVQIIRCCYYAMKFWQVPCINSIFGSTLNFGV
jgi:hypothetical protein